MTFAVPAFAAEFNSNKISVFTQMLETQQEGSVNLIRKDNIHLVCFGLLLDQTRPYLLDCFRWPYFAHLYLSAPLFHSIRPQRIGVKYVFEINSRYKKLKNQNFKLYCLYIATQDIWNSFILSRALSLSPPLSLTHTYTHTLSLSLTRTHTLSLCRCIHSLLSHRFTKTAY